MHLECIQNAQNRHACQMIFFNFRARSFLQPVPLLKGRKDSTLALDMITDINRPHPGRSEGVAARGIDPPREKRLDNCG
jgi:hypothetical protein